MVFIIIFASLCPLGLEFFVFRNEFYSVLDNGQWSGFLGSFLGGILGGIGTLLAVYITTNETRAIQRNTEIQINRDREINRKSERKKFTDDIATIVAEYITDISAYFYANRVLERLNKTENGLLNNLTKIEKTIYDKLTYQKSVISDSDSDKLIMAELEIVQLKEEQATLKNKVNSIKKEIIQNRKERTIAIKCYFLLKIKLENIEEAKNLITQLMYLHNNSANVEGTSLDWIDEETKKLLKITTRFIENYIYNKLI